ncbi:hypothetical protein PBY51_023776 [Eleginops maclovinus]|uniref:Uncharacterized protein n=1 Tax=Eleginops maclovinus TaxID=56733 RepID=A0AAN8AEN3_ELEMC|nr:hypothetical protein PBY51_023776 [Eleginops maclovinus]
MVVDPDGLYGKTATYHLGNILNPAFLAAAAGHMRQKQLQIVTINRFYSFGLSVLTGAVCLSGSHSPWTSGLLDPVSESVNST